ncbi:MAG: substrate-binding domain-containing protein [Clostridium sp.]|nr:substrate-binding domain-containing protein [Clostridium sp.]
MEKRGAFLWGSLAGMLVILYLMSSTDLIIKERKNEIYPVSVVLGDTSDDYYGNFRKGIERAAADYNADTSFITLFQEGDAVQQMDLVWREIDDGAGAVILQPVDSVECARLLGERTLSTPLVIAGEMLPGEIVYTGVSVNYFEQGRMMGEAIAKTGSPEVPVYVFAEQMRNGSTRERYDGLMSVLQQQDRNVLVYEGKHTDTFRKAIEEMVYPGNGMAVIAALDPFSTGEAADIIGGSPVYGKYVAGLYGTGTTPSLLNQLDKGVIRGLVVSNEFDIGYLCVEKAVKSMERKAVEGQTMLESFYIEREDLRDRSIEKMLYPIG